MNAMPHMDKTSALIKYRLDSATERLSAAKFMLKEGHYKALVVNTYFTILTAARAVLAATKDERKNFLTDVRSVRRRYIKAGVFAEKFSAYFDAAYKIRHACDYGDFVIVSREAAETQYQQAVEFIEAVKNYLYVKELT